MDESDAEASSSDDARDGGEDGGGADQASGGDGGADARLCRDRTEHMDESDGGAGASEAEASASDDARDGGEDGGGADRASGGDGGADPLANGGPSVPRGERVDKPAPRKKVYPKTYKLKGRAMTADQFREMFDRPWQRIVKDGEVRGGKDKRHHGLALELDESTDPPVRRLHCTLCGVPINGKVGVHLRGDRHWNRYRLKLQQAGVDSSAPDGVEVDSSAPEGEVDERPDGIDPVVTGDRHERDEATERPRRRSIPSRHECDVVTERLRSLRSRAGERFRPPALLQDTGALLDLLPARWRETLERTGTERVRDVALDLGRWPCCWRDGRRLPLHEEVVEERDLREIASKLRDFGEGNRTGMDGQLHRISCVRNDRNDIVGFTIRVGRHFEGTSDMIRDLLEESDKSILFLGEHGSGKTTAVRDAARILSQRSNVFVVDTWNDIAGHGNVPHPSIGDARRMMVRSPASQANAMVECVRNHGPSVVAIDEIGSISEAEAALTCKDQGVRIIAAAASRDLRSLIRNADVLGLVGGVDAIAADASAAAPVFDVVVELDSGRMDEWHVITNAAQAADDILRGMNYDVQKRRRCTRSGEISVEHGKS